jgi:hypothetical protein
LKKAAEDRKYYELNLIQREGVYNSMFGANPRVGVVDPLAGKLAKQNKGAPVGNLTGMTQKGGVKQLKI